MYILLSSLMCPVHLNGSSEKFSPPHRECCGKPLEEYKGIIQHANEGALKIGVGAGVFQRNDMVFLDVY
jgi:hypothetical protein